MSTNMKENATTNNSRRDLESHSPIDKAIAWLRVYVDAHPYTGGAEEAQSIVNELRAVRRHPALDELLALLAQIAKTDQGLQKIHRAKMQIKQCKYGLGE
jgi:hypothetical protein